MNLVDRLMRAWAEGLRRKRLCEWCRSEVRDPATARGAYCSPRCQIADAEAQALSF